MGVSIIVGGQLGSEGKGKIAEWWGRKIGCKTYVRVGGTNSGHTVIGMSGTKHAFRMLPSAASNKGNIVVLPALAIISVPILMREINEMGLDPSSVKVDPLASIIDESCVNEEVNAHMNESIGSTQSGTGQALVHRIEGNGVLARDIEELKPFLCDTKRYMRETLNMGEEIVIEGTQGYGLSIYSNDYPFCTSRACTASSFLSETGLSPFDVNHVVMVIRSYPIRVAGNSGPLYEEIDWETVTKESGADKFGVHLSETTTVTNRTRRVGRFDADMVKRAIMENKPDVIVMNHVDYFDYSFYDSGNLSYKQIDKIQQCEQAIERRIDYVGNGENSVIKFNKHVI